MLVTGSIGLTADDIKSRLKDKYHIQSVVSESLQIKGTEVTTTGSLNDDYNLLYSVIIPYLTGSI
jgi:hypothetical protein